MIGFFKPTRAATIEEIRAIEGHCRQALGAIDNEYMDTPNRLYIRWSVDSH